MAWKTSSDHSPAPPRACLYFYSELASLSHPPPTRMSSVSLVRERRKSLSVIVVGVNELYIFFSELVSASQGEASRWSIFSQGKIGAGPDIVIAGPGVIGSAQTHLYS